MALPDETREVDIRVLRGQPDPVELAAISAVLTAALDELASEQRPPPVAGRLGVAAQSARRAPSARPWCLADVRRVAGRRPDAGRCVPQETTTMSG